METYKSIKRRYFETHSMFEQSKEGTFVARGQWADGHLAYSRLDDEGNEIEGEECAYVQVRGALVIDHKVVARTYMQRI